MKSPNAPLRLLASYLMSLSIYLFILFEVGGDLYVPRNESMKFVYTSVILPNEWRYEKTLMRDVSAIDTVLFKRDGIFGCSPIFALPGLARILVNSTFLVREPFIYRVE